MPYVLEFTNNLRSCCASIANLVPRAFPFWIGSATHIQKGKALGTRLHLSLNIADPDLHIERKYRRIDGSGQKIARIGGFAYRYSPLSCSSKTVKPNNKLSVIDQACSLKMASSRYWQSFFICGFMDLDFMSVHSKIKNVLGQYRPFWLHDLHARSITHIWKSQEFILARITDLDRSSRHNRNNRPVIEPCG